MLTVATWITLSRLLVIPPLLYWLQQPTPTERWLAAGVFGLAAATDWLDGYVARRWQQETELGKFLDPLVDKLLVLAPLLSLVALQQLPAWAVFLILGRELAIAGWRANQPQVVGANRWGKLKTVSQIGAILLLLAPLPPPWPSLAQGTFWLALGLTLLSGLLYLWPPPHGRAGAEGCGPP